MNIKRKYVRFAKGIVTFPDRVIHSDLAEDLEAIMGRVISAGFTDGETCWGKSISLRKESRPDDTECLELGKGEYQG